MAPQLFLTLQDGLQQQLFSPLFRKTRFEKRTLEYCACQELQ